MTVDFYEASASLNPLFFSEFDSTIQRPDQAEWSLNRTQRPHLRLYERQQTTVAKAQTPQSPSNDDSSFGGCWSPILASEDEPVKWSNGYDSVTTWIKNSSSENLTTSSTEDYDSESYQQTGQYGYNHQVPLNGLQWPSSTQTTNDENTLCQMIKYNLDLGSPQPPVQASLTRKWSQEDTSSKTPHNNFYAPYIQSNYQRMHSLDDYQFIPVTNVKWSTADGLMQAAAAPKNAFVQPQVVDRRFKSQPERQIFAQLNASSNLSRRQPSTMGCDETEIQWYHHHLELQQCVYDQIYSKVLSGELKKKQAAKNQSQQNDFSAGVQPTSERTPPAITLPSSSSPPSPSAIELAAKLDQCTAQYRQLEKERKKTEAELAKHHLGKKISSSNNLQIPRLPTAPSRIDRLIVDFFREHARVVTLLCRMEQLKDIQFDANLHKVMHEWLDAIRLLQQRRLSERNAILSHLSGELGYYDEEKELTNQKDALVTLTRAAIRARSANWCALTQTLGVDSPRQQMQLERIQSLDYCCEPPEIQARPLASANHY